MITFPVFRRPGYSRIEKISFEPYNESPCLIEAVERFKERTRYYPERVLADLITTKLEETQLASIALSVFVLNLYRLQRRILLLLSNWWFYYGKKEDSLQKSK